MTIAGRMVRERERCIGMSPEERAWRAQWLKDQILTEREPVYVKELHQKFRNPFRRLYMRPLDALILEPLIPKLVSNCNSICFSSLLSQFVLCYYVMGRWVR